jgi:hypothetical protein
VTVSGRVKLWLRVLRRSRLCAGTARRHTFKIFAPAVFRVALRTGTKFGGTDASAMAVRRDVVNELIDGICGVVL